MNDTGHWLWLRTFVGSSSLTVALYGMPQNRKVVSDVTPLVVTGAAPDKRVPDPSLFVGQKVLDQAGSPSSSTSVRRRVYSASGKLLYDHTWYSRYQAEPNVIRVGTKPRPKPTPPTGKNSQEGSHRPPPLLRRHPASSCAAPAAALGLGAGDRLGEPGRNACRPVIADRDASMGRPPVSDRLAVPLDLVVEAKASATKVAAARVNREAVVEAGRVPIASVRLERQRVDAFVAQLLVAAAEAPQVLDARDLEPDEVRGVVGDTLSVRLRKADDDLGRELEVGHVMTMLA